jgi:ABC-type Na+ efflux pump permease subunit
MADPIVQITDTDLLAKLATSRIGDEQKERLKSLVSDMTPAEKAELLALIDRSNQEAETMDKNYQENLGKLNQEYLGKLNQASKDGNTRSRKEFEKLEQSQKGETLRVIEGEVSAIDFVPKKTKNGSNGQSHTLRNMILALLMLALLAGGGLVALNYLTNL